jgi:hypothetical protein
MSMNRGSEERSGCLMERKKGAGDQGSYQNLIVPNWHISKCFSGNILAQQPSRIKRHERRESKIKIRSEHLLYRRDVCKE